MTDRQLAPTYRQRFTGKGYLGATLTLLAPIVWGVVVSAGQSNAYSEASPLGLALAGFMAILGPMLMLVGREYYDAAPDIAKAQENAAKIRAEYNGRKAGS
ncbi:TPA: hypothetical protein MK151_004719 [Salmonella enterica subsp. enterica serovar Weltevreden]|nr:hypothetical protein [Salmonella enterica subsp. enterica serovar Weltevreden]